MGNKDHNLKKLRVDRDWLVCIQSSYKVWNRNMKQMCEKKNTIEKIPLERRKKMKL